MRDLIEHITDEVIENAFAGTNFGRTDFRVILAEVILKTNCSYHCGHTATSIAAGLGLITSRNRTMSGFDAGWKSTKAGHEFAIDAYYTNRPGSVVRQLKAAEARIAELTADLDKESEIRHRIHEELNAFKGEQQSVVEQLEAAQRERDEAVLLRLEVSVALSSATVRYEQAEAELKRRDAQEPVAWISERNLNNLGKQFSVYVKHEPVMVRPVALYTHPAVLLPELSEE